MFIIREYAACGLLVLMLATPLAALLFAAYGIGYLAKVTRIMFVRARR